MWLLFRFEKRLIFFKVIIRSKDKVYLINILDDLLIRYTFVIALTLFTYERKYILNNLIDIDCINIYIIINKILVSNIYKKL